MSAIDLDLDPKKDDARDDGVIRFLPVRFYNYDENELFLGDISPSKIGLKISFATS